MQNQGESYLNDPRIAVRNGASFNLNSFSTNYSAGITSYEDAETRLKVANKRMYKAQNKLYASDNHSVLLIFQGMDAAGKDSTIRSVFSGVNPSGFQVSSYKAPSKEELDHDFLWRCNLDLPERGRIGIFNRSHYEEVLICKVHPGYVLGQRIPRISSIEDLDQEFWLSRYRSIANWEKHLAENGTKVMKFFLNVSKEEQKRRLLSRIENQKRNWKFNIADLKERSRWDDYMLSYSDAITNTAFEHAPWYVIPADNKDIMRTVVAELVADAIDELDLKYPSVGEKEIKEMKEAEGILKNEK